MPFKQWTGTGFIMINLIFTLKKTLLMERLKTLFTQYSEILYSNINKILPLSLLLEYLLMIKQNVHIIVIYQLKRFALIIQLANVQALK